MKKYLLLLFLCYGLTAVGQTDVPLNVPGIGHGATVNDPNFRFNYLGFPVGHYALGWYNENGSSPLGYLSGYAGLRFFTAANPRMSIDPNGNVGIGVLSPDNRLTVRDNNPFIDVQSAEDGQHTGIWMRYRNSSYAGTKLYYGTADAVTYLDNLYPNESGTPYGSFNIRNKNNLGELVSRLFVQGTTGDIGIGTVDPKGYRLAVNGKIRAQEIKIEASPWPDYVFAKDYQLPSLQETEKHIKEKGHLPGIPSAEEVKANGIDVGEMNAKLLQKIEEMTLYIIDLEKRMKLMEMKK